MIGASEEEKFDIFISYNHDDNQTFGQGEWVTEFKNDLFSRIKQRDGRPLKIYIDKRQTGIGGTLPELLESVIANSRYLLPIVTPLYTRSDWCDLERIKFIETHGPSEALQRVIRVDKEPVEDVAGELEDLKQYRFYYRDEAKQIDLIVSKENRPGRYFELITELALHIIHDISAVSKSRDNTIYVARTSGKLNERRNQICKELEQRGFNVVPTSLGVLADKAYDKARRNLEQSFMSIHLIDSEFEPILKGTDVSADRIQFDAAAKIGEDKLMTYVWCESTSMSDERQQELLEKVEQTNITDLMHDFYAFKEEITVAAHAHRDSREREVTVVPNTVNVYVHYGPADEDASDVAAICDALTDCGLEVFTPDFSQEDPHAARSACTAILYYFGAEPYKQTYYAIKTGTDGSDGLSSCGICLKCGEVLRNPTTKAVVMEAADSGIDRETLAPFLESLGVT